MPNTQIWRQACKFYLEIFRSHMIYQPGKHYDRMHLKVNINKQHTYLKIRFDLSENFSL